ncbi:MAG: YidC/Oxa1 family membrane protein insertase [Euzebyales bacterium]|nr:YidC/Oxa1 family membrane protein insertase [Euzebyales bacterium]
MSALWNGLLDVIEEVLRFFHTTTSPLFGEQAAWGWAIILLTVAVRIFLLPLAIKQTRSQRAMQRLQPEMKKIQQKYKVDRGLMKTNPEKYRDARQKQQEATMALYKEQGVNPAASCLPLVAQMPIFFALFNVLRDTNRVPELTAASFYFVQNLASTPAQAGIGAWLLIVLMGATTYYSSRQMMATTVVTGPQQQQQQKIMLYAMPLLLTVFAVNLYIGVLLYWVTTNVWTIAQQHVMFRNVEAVGTSL